MAKREASASPVVRQIDKQFLVCSICLDRYHNPKVLPCLHTFCERIPLCLHSFCEWGRWRLAQPKGVTGQGETGAFLWGSVYIHPVRDHGWTPLYRQLGQEEKGNHELFKQAVLREFGLTPEMYQERFRSARLSCRLSAVGHSSWGSGRHTPWRRHPMASSRALGRPVLRRGVPPPRAGVRVGPSLGIWAPPPCATSSARSSRGSGRRLLVRRRVDVPLGLGRRLLVPASGGAFPLAALGAPWRAAVRVMEFYCESCETAMCRECTEGEHREHVTVPLRNVVEQHKASLQQQLDAIKSRLPQLTAAIGLVTEISKQLMERKNAAVGEISGSFAELEQALQQRKGLLVRDLEATCSAKQKVLQAQLDALRQGQENILSSCTFTEQALHHGTETEVLLVKKQMSERLSALASQEFPEQPQENDQLDYVVETDGVRKSILNLGVLITTSAIAHKTVATGEGLRHAVVGQPSSLTITTKDKDGELVRSGSASLQAQVTAPDGGRAEVEVLDNKNGTYELVYTPRQEGDFLLSILLYGQPIRGSPFRTKALKACDMPPSPDDVKRRVKSPSSGHIRQKAVRRPSSMYGSGKKKENPIEDELIFRVGSRGREKGEFTNLQGISTSSSGRIVVADSNNQCVQVFSNEGQFRLRFGMRGRSPGQLQRPTGVTVDMNGDIIIADYDNRWVSIFSPEGKFKVRGQGRALFPGGGRAPPSPSACPSATLWGLPSPWQSSTEPTPPPGSSVAPPLPQVYSADGEFLFKFGSHGEGNGQFNAPTGVAVDSNGNIIVADWGNSRIQVGSEVWDLPGGLWEPARLAVPPLPPTLALPSPALEKCPIPP
nr:tripartite motif-containing protein 3-like [Chelonoidis abingdonii]